MRHCCEFLKKNVFDPHACIGRTMPLGSTHPFAAFLLEHPNLRSARFAVDDRDHLRVRHEGGSRDGAAAVRFGEQHVSERQFRARFARRPVEPHEPARRHLHLTSARLDDCVHSLYPCKSNSVQPKSLSCKQLRSDGTIDLDTCEPGGQFGIPKIDATVTTLAAGRTSPDAKDSAD